MKKTVKSFAKRLKITKNGKILARAVGQNHFNARERTRASMKKHRMSSVAMNNDVKSRFLINLK
jgi:ribosomal protein L35